MFSTWSLVVAAMTAYKGGRHKIGRKHNAREKTGFPILLDEGRLTNATTSLGVGTARTCLNAANVFCDPTSQKMIFSNRHADPRSSSKLVLLTTIFTHRSIRRMQQPILYLSWALQAGSWHQLLFDEISVAFAGSGGGGCRSSAADSCHCRLRHVWSRCNLALLLGFHLCPGRKLQSPLQLSSRALRP